MRLSGAEAKGSGDRGYLLLFLRLRRLSLALACDSFPELSRYDLPDATPRNQLRFHLAAQGDYRKPNGFFFG